MNIIIGNDHGAIELKNELIEYLITQDNTITNIGVDTSDSVDYPDIAKECCKQYLEGEYDFGILLCGTGIGISIAANKVSKIRAALPQTVFAATMAKEHNNANFICFGQRVTYGDKITDMLDAFMNSEFEGGRHATRVNKIES